MPSTSAKQHRFMAAIAHGWRPPKGQGPSRKVAEEFVKADKGKRFVRAVGQRLSRKS